MRKISLSILLLLNVSLSLWAACNASGKLPVMYITTNSGKDITSKEEYVDATYYIDASGCSQYQSVGSKSQPLKLQIKGRGNWTWRGFDKKPYRLKLETKTELLGMAADRNWALLAHADDNMAYMRNVMGFSASKVLEMEWTPSYVPVELVKNGEYWGIYMLTETIRVSKHRVNVTEQDDKETNPANITGGWLVEIDNYDTDPHITFYEGGDEESPIWVTYHSPEDLSQAQDTYLTNLFKTLDAAIYTEDKTSREWEKYVDMDELVNFYIVQELLNNQESFHGSCYIHKDRGVDTKLIFGPVWDFGNSYYCDNSIYIYDDPPYGQAWIGEIAKFPRFQAAVRKRWNDVWWKIVSEVEADMNAVNNLISGARSADCCRWNKYCTSNDDFKNAKKALENRYAWLQERWVGTGIGETEASEPFLAVYPNAVTDGVLYIASSEGNIERAALYSLAGNVQKDFSDAASGRLELGVGAGLYILKVQVSGKVITRKVLVR